jgi:hypothetical protein
VTLPARHRRVAYHLTLVTDSERQLLATQQSLIEEWIASDEARAAAERYLRWRGLGGDPAEICNEAWMRLTGSLQRRDEPLPAVTSINDAAAYCTRVIDNIVRDRRRAALRAASSPLDGLAELTAATGGSTHESQVLDRVMVEQLLHLVASRGVGDVRCDGCPPAVVVATALEVLHMVLAGDEGGERGRDWFDRIVHTALGRVDGGDRTERAQDQRKSRCGRCVVDLLGSAMREITGEGR